MARDEVFKRLSAVFAEVFDDDELVLSETTTAADVDGWDSLTHIRMILAVEQKFKVRFSAAQVAQLANVGDLLALIASKTTL